MRLGGEFHCRVGETPVQLLIVLFRLMANACYRGEAVLGSQVAMVVACEIAQRRSGTGESGDVTLRSSAAIGDGNVPSELLGARAEIRRGGGCCEL